MPDENLPLSTPPLHESESDPPFRCMTLRLYQWEEEEAAHEYSDLMSRLSSHTIPSTEFPTKDKPLSAPTPSTPKSD